MSPGEPKTLRSGRERYQRLAQREAVRRVAAYRKWLKAGSPVGRMPAVPSDAEFKLARRSLDAGAARRRAE